MNMRGELFEDLCQCVTCKHLHVVDFVVLCVCVHALFLYLLCLSWIFFFLYVSQRFELTACIGSTYQLQLWSCDVLKRWIRLPANRNDSVERILPRYRLCSAFVLTWLPILLYHLVLKL